MRGVFARQRDEVIGRLMAEGARVTAGYEGWSRRKVEEDIAAKGVLDDINLDELEEAQVLRMTFTPILRAMVDEVGSETIRQIGATTLFNVNDPMVQTWLGSRMEMFSKTVSGTSFVKINQVLRDGFMAGKPSSVIANELRATFSSWDKYRAPLIARTETMAGLNMAELFSVKEAGLDDVLKKSWLSAQDEATRLTHVEAGIHYSAPGIPIKNAFHVGNDHMQTPCTGAVASENVNCRCVVRYIRAAPEEGPKKPRVTKPRAPRVAKPAFPVVLPPAVSPVIPMPVMLPTVPAPAPVPVPDVSASLKMGKGWVSHKKAGVEIDRAKELIDSVHGDGKLKVIPIDIRVMPTNWAQYEHGERYPLNICVNPKLDNLRVASDFRLSTVHEIGHFMDNSVFTEPNLPAQWGSHGGPNLHGVMDAIKNSDAYSAMRASKGLTVKPGYVAEVAGSYAADPYYVSYLLRDHEVFARAYSQYIAGKTGDIGMLDSVRKAVADPPHGFRHWKWTDFQPIMDAFDDLFRSRGWLRMEGVQA